MSIEKVSIVSILILVAFASAFGQKVDYISQWDVYLDNNNPTHARSIVIDMGLIQVLPVAGYGSLGVLSITLNSPNSDGLPHGSKYKNLVRVEDMMAPFASSMGIYTYRVAKDGEWNFAYYLSDTSNFRSNCNQLMATLPEYKFAVSITNDPTWNNYLAHYPDKYQFESMGNTAVILQLKERGDKLLVARDVNHYAYFPSAASRKLMESDVKKMGFVIEQKQEVGGKLPFELVFSRDDKVDQENIDKLTHKLLDLCLKYGGDYDGWECLVITN